MLDEKWSVLEDEVSQFSCGGEAIRVVKWKYVISIIFDGCDTDTDNDFTTKKVKYQK